MWGGAKILEALFITISFKLDPYILKKNFTFKKTKYIVTLYSKITPNTKKLQTNH